MYRWSKVLLEDIQQGSSLLGAKTAVYYLLKMYAGSSPDRIAYPAQDTLASISGLSKSSVQKALKQLQEAKWIQRVGYTDSLKRTAIYRIMTPEERESKILLSPPVRSYEGGTEDLTNNKESSKKNQEERERPSFSSSSSINQSEPEELKTGSFWNNLQGLS